MSNKNREGKRGLVDHAANIQILEGEKGEETMAEQLAKNAPRTIRFRNTKVNTHKRTSSESTIFNMNKVPRMVCDIAQSTGSLSRKSELWIHIGSIDGLINPLRFFDFAQQVGNRARGLNVFRYRNVCDAMLHSRPHHIPG